MRRKRKLIVNRLELVACGIQLKRVIQKNILNRLSKMILADEVTPDVTITVDYIDDDFVFYQKKTQ